MQDLVVISLPRGGQSVKWPSKQKWFLAEGCARHLLVGKTELLAEVPSDVLEKAERTPALTNSYRRMNPQQTMMYAGRDAYHFLLRFATGLESQKASEYFVLQDLRNKWKAHREKHWSEANTRELVKTMDHIFADTKSVRHHVYGQNLPSVSYQHSALAMAQIKKGDRVLLIADRGDITKHAARVVGRDVDEGVKKMTVTHPVDFALLDRIDELTQLQQQKLIGSSLTFEFFSEAMDLATTADHVVVCTPMMDTLLSTHQQIADIWRQREKKSGKLVLLGDRKRDSDMHNFWQEAALENCILPDVIRSKYIADVELHQKILQRASDACHRAALAREAGLTSGVVSEIIANHSDTPLDTVIAHIDGMGAVRQEMVRAALLKATMA